ncbi:MAG TPA: cellulose biosynthesis protein BcsQ [Granulicella sp.]|nr:cellulose biosynthesis protein BcsQ [Granulicella sp.]
MPEDVAILYSWANLQGAKYRDFSASRREYRAQMRRRSAEMLREQELQEAAEADAATTAAESQAEATDAANQSFVDSVPDAQSEHSRLLAMQEAEHEESRQSPGEWPANEAFLTPQQEATPSDYPAQPFPAAPSGSERIPNGNGHTSERGPQARNGVVSLPSYPMPTPSPVAARPATPANGFTPLGRPLPFHEPQRSGAAAPAWFHGREDGGRFQPPVQAASAATGNTLQHSRERVAARWYALKGVFQQPGLDLAPDLHPNRQNEVHTPILAVFSLAGGVGKTSLVATLGRALSSLGEQVLLADTTSHGLLPFYFGASDLIPGVVRNFLPPPGSKDAPIHLVGYDVDRRGEIQTRDDRRNEDAGAQDKLAVDLLRDSQGTHRVLLDLPATSSWVVRRVARMNPTVLIPLAPDMNSVITLQAVNQFLQSIQDADGHPLSPYFILNQFDPTLPLHIDVREVLRQQLGDRLLPFVIHRAPAISEALAEGMTIIDYAPDSVAAQDYLNVATWIRSIATSRSAGFRHARWSER